MAGNPTEIAEGTKIDGTIESDGDLIVRGRVEGTTRLTAALEVQPAGIIVADVEVKTCVVAGSVAGNIVASDSVRILEGGRMVGDIKSPRVILDAGGKYRGNVDMGNIEAAPSKRTREKAERAEPVAAASGKAKAGGGRG